MKCGAFKAGLTIHPDGKASPCCVFDHRYYKDLENLDMKDPWHDLKNGEGCSACNVSKPYMWQFDKYIYGDEFRDDPDYKVRYLDVRNNNLCNFECSICNSYYSSKWAQRLNENQQFKKTKFDVDLTDVEHIYFAGGEPFLNPTHFEVIDSIPNKENVKLLYSSNLTYIDRIQEYASDFKSVQINASLDAIGEYGEQIRKGLNWKKFKKNIETLTKIKNVKLVISPTISLLNVHEIDKIYYFAESYNLEVEPIVLTGPDYLKVSALPQSIKSEIGWKLKRNIPDLIEQLKIEYSTHQIFPHSIANILLGDKLRETNVYDYLCDTMPHFKNESLKVLQNNE